MHGGEPQEKDQLHPLLVHHILNTLEWRTLRPLQKAAAGPIARGEHVLLTAPTAGGKTEAAVFPILSRMLSGDWEPLSVLYLCPLRALLNNLHPRIQHYADLVGRRAGLWHGDVSESQREAIRDEPPDILLTTPESIEAMLISGKTRHERFFRNVRAVVVDEIHAFAGDDRGWHLLAVTERVQRLAGRELQRVGLSATVGNESEILGWLTRTSPGSRSVVRSPEDTGRPAPEVTVDYVGELSNAATVISRLHRGEKRLVFVDSRARVEALAAELRDRDVETYVSHGSLGREERHAAEKAFSTSRNCVIVATSTLELGIDVGDLDRVIQIDSPPSVASFLQRLGRTGRREGTPSNTLLLATREADLLQTLGLLRCWADGFVEPLNPPALPLHLLVQQLLAIVLQERGVGRTTWTEWGGRPFVLGGEVLSYADPLTESLVRRGFLFEDNGILGMGTRGEEAFGRRHFIDLMAVFSEPPMMKVMAGRTELGSLPIRLFLLEASDGHVVLLGGRDWFVRDIDWKRGVVQVEPAGRRGKVRWFGEGRALSFEICQGMKRVLVGEHPQGVSLSTRAKERLALLREGFGWVTGQDELVITTERDGIQFLWTWAGSEINAWIVVALRGLADEAVPGDLSVQLARGADPSEVAKRLAQVDPPLLHLGEAVAHGGVERLKFAEALPDEEARSVVERRLRDDDGVRRVCGWPVRSVGRAPQ